MWGVVGIHRNEQYVYHAYSIKAIAQLVRWCYAMTYKTYYVTRI